MPKKQQHYKTIVLSDIHLGSKWSKTKEVTRFLKQHSCDTLREAYRGYCREKRLPRGNLWAYPLSGEKDDRERVLFEFGRLDGISLCLDRGLRWKLERVYRGRCTYECSTKKGVL